MRTPISEKFKKTTKKNSAAVKKWREQKEKEYDLERLRVMEAEKRRAELIETINNPPKIVKGDVEDVLSALDFIFSGKDNKYRYSVMKVVMKELKKLNKKV